MNPDTLAATLLDASPDGLLLVDQTGAIRLANRTAAELFGFGSDELVGTCVDELVPTELRDAHVAHRSSYDVEPRRRPIGTGLHLFAQHRDGSLFPVEISLSPIALDDEVLTIATVRDVSARQDVLARMALLKERERIARDLHDMVIQRLFAAGMSLQAVASASEPPHVSERINDVTAELDQVIHELRSAIFQLGIPDVRQSLSAHLAAVTEERARHLGFAPTLRIVGELDQLPEHLGEQLVATLVEALSNVARHARASRVDVEVTCTGMSLSLAVRDDGVGISEAPNPHGGLSNMMWRAAELGGTCSVGPAEAGGTEVNWNVPV